MDLKNTLTQSIVSEEQKQELEQPKSLLSLPEVQEPTPVITEEPTEVAESKKLIKDGFDDKNNDVTVNDSFEQAFHVVPKKAPPVDRKKFTDKIEKLQSMYQKAKSSTESKQMQTVIAQSLVKLVGSVVAYNNGVPLGKLEMFTPDFDKKLDRLNSELDRDIGLVQGEEAAATADRDKKQARFDRDAEARRKGNRDRLDYIDSRADREADLATALRKEKKSDARNARADARAERTLAGTEETRKFNRERANRQDKESTRQFNVNDEFRNRQLGSQEKRDLFKQLQKAKKDGKSLSPQQEQFLKKQGDKDSAFVDNFEKQELSIEGDISKLANAENLLVENPEIGGIVNSWAAALNLDKKARNVKDLVESVVQKSLRATIGAQFAAKEADQLFARTYNPALSSKHNLYRLRILSLGIQGKQDIDRAKYEYIQANGSSDGFHKIRKRMSEKVRGEIRKVAQEGTKELDRLEKGEGSGSTSGNALTAEDKQALEWANSNPEDPRAKQIKERLGR